MYRKIILYRKGEVLAQVAPHIVSFLKRQMRKLDIMKEEARVNVTIVIMHRNRGRGCLFAF